MDLSESLKNLIDGILDSFSDASPDKEPGIDTVVETEEYSLNGMEIREDNSIISIVDADDIYSDTPIDTVSDAINLLEKEFGGKNKEYNIVLGLDEDKNPTGFCVINTGSVNRTTLDIETIQQFALATDCDSVIQIHNHPSGDCHASSNDVMSLDGLAQACENIGVPLADAVIISDNDENAFFSIRSMDKYTKDSASDYQLLLQEDASVINHHSMSDFPAPNPDEIPLRSEETRDSDIQLRIDKCSLIIDENIVSGNISEDDRHILTHVAEDFAPYPKYESRTTAMVNMFSAIDSLDLPEEEALDYKYMLPAYLVTKNDSDLRLLENEDYMSKISKALSASDNPGELVEALITSKDTCATASEITGEIITHADVDLIPGLNGELVGKDERAFQCKGMINDWVQSGKLSEKDIDVYDKIVDNCIAEWDYQDRVSAGLNLVNEIDKMPSLSEDSKNELKDFVAQTMSLANNNTIDLLKSYELGTLVERLNDGYSSPASDEEQAHIEEHVKTLITATNTDRYRSSILSGDFHNWDDFLDLTHNNTLHQEERANACKQQIDKRIESGELSEKDRDCYYKLVDNCITTWDYQERIDAGVNLISETEKNCFSLSQDYKDNFKDYVANNMSNISSKNLETLSREDLGNIIYSFNDGWNLGFGVPEEVQERIQQSLKDFASRDSETIADYALTIKVHDMSVYHTDERNPLSERYAYQIDKNVRAGNLSEENAEYYSSIIEQCSTLVDFKDRVTGAVNLTSEVNRMKSLSDESKAELKDFIKDNIYTVGTGNISILSSPELSNVIDKINDGYTSVAPDNVQEHITEYVKGLMSYSDPSYYTEQILNDQLHDKDGYMVGKSWDEMFGLDEYAHKDNDLKLEQEEHSLTHEDSEKEPESSVEAKDKTELASGLKQEEQINTSMLSDQTFFQNLERERIYKRSGNKDEALENILGNIDTMSIDGDLKDFLKQNITSSIRDQSSDNITLMCDKNKMSSVFESLNRSDDPFGSALDFLNSPDMKQSVSGILNVSTLDMEISDNTTVSIGNSVPHRGLVQTEIGEAR